MEIQKPSVGRVVHYVEVSGQHLAALVGHVNTDKPDHLTLSVCHVGSVPQWHYDVPFSAAKKAGTWHYPEPETRKIMVPDDETPPDEGKEE